MMQTSSPALHVWKPVVKTYPIVTNSCVDLGSLPLSVFPSPVCWFYPS